MTIDKNTESRIKELESLIEYHQNAYYNNEAEITDYEFDELWDELKVLDPNNTILHKVGIDNFGFKKLQHLMPMGSQNKASDPTEFEKWFSQMTKEKENKYIVQYKMDGLSIELQYKDNKFIAAVTRGDGQIGDDVTNNIIKTGIVQVLPTKKGIPEFTGAIRGEVLLSHRMKDLHFKDKENCRNAANGCLKRKDGKGCEYLHIVVYDAFPTIPSLKLWSCEEEKVYWLKSTGYDVVPTKTFIACNDIINYRNEVNILRPTYDYDIDGIVVKSNKVDLEDMKRDRPKKQIAFKFILDEMHTVLLDVEWSTSGKYRTPVAICEPVKLGGTTVKRASLANYGLIQKLGLKIGDTVILVKRGEIIPKIIGIVKTETNHVNKSIIPPVLCEVCGTELINDGAYVVCPNENCPEQIAHRIQKWISTQGIKFIGDSTIHKLVEQNFIHSIADLYKPEFFIKLSRPDIAGEKTAKKICDNINAQKNIKLSHFISGFDIDHIGSRVIESLENFGFNTLDKIMNAPVTELCMCVGINMTLAGYIKNGMQKVKDEMYEVLKQGVMIIENNSSGIFAGKSACFTGSFNRFSRTELENMFTSEGGKVGNKVSKNTMFLVSNNRDSTSGKTAAANQYNIPIINEEEFLKYYKS